MPTPDSIKTYRDPFLSLWQSAVQKVTTSAPGFASAATTTKSESEASALMGPAHLIGTTLSSGNELPASITAPAPAVAPHLLGGVVDCAETAAKFLWAEIKGNQHDADLYAATLKSSVCDALGWAECLTTYLAYKVAMQSLPYRPNQNIVVSIPDDARIAIIGDWGTGGAAATNLLEQVATFKPDILLHLGDVYFAGTKDEANDNFLAICRKVLGNIPLYSLCGNHDMYSGGDGYYWLLDQIGQGSSYFCLQNDYWMFLAMDTGYNDRDPLTVNSNMTSLYNSGGWSEAEWHIEKIQQAGDRRIALLSHHQLFSPFGSVGNDAKGNPSAINPSLLNVFETVLPKVDLWFWGHEHILALYDFYAGLVRGRCVGASAIPVFTDQQSYVADSVLIHDDLKELPGWNTVGNLGSSDGCYNNAFAIMKLNGAAAATVNYYQVPLGKPYVEVPFTDTI